RNRPDGSNRSDRGDAAVRMPVPQLNAPRLKWRFHTASVGSCHSCQWSHCASRIGMGMKNGRRFSVLAAAAFATIGQPQTANARAIGTRAGLPPGLEAAIAESHEALRKILNGDPSGYAALFADRDDVTLGNPFGPFGKGRAAVLQALNNASTKYRDGTVVGVERVAVYADRKLVVLVEIEHDRAKLGPNPDFAEFAARVTSVYEKIGASWKLVHRHADPITAARQAESMLGK
ncbi:nuclear transport factor 2 family protein, partial [Sphingomonas sp. RT2P30]|uniref:YybH family protein n=1 Tax=Parasphingomonas halimpatiens TaxID=3096162 RepID=UPI002FC77839